MVKPLLMVVSLSVLILWLSACSAQNQQVDGPDVDATVEAAIAATRAAEAAAEAESPPETPMPPTPTSEPESPPALDVQVLDLEEAAIQHTPQVKNFATDLTFRLVIEDETVSELVIEGVTNVNGDSAITYDFSHTDVAPVLRTVTILNVDHTTYFSLPDGRCVSAAMGDPMLGEMVVETGRILLDTESMVTGRMQPSGVTEVHGIVTDEYVGGIDNLAVDMGITNVTYGVLNIAQEENYIVRLILQGQGASEVLSPGVPGELYYELNFIPRETPFEIEVPAACITLDMSVFDDDEPDHDIVDSAGAESDVTEGDVALEDKVEVVISQGGQNIAHHCRGGNVVIESAGSNISLSGSCNEVVVNGTGNNVDIEAAAAISVGGIGNHIVYSGSPAITDRGMGNVLEQR